MPRMRIGGAIRALFAEVAEHARDVEGEDIHPATVSIGNQQVIDAAGRVVAERDGLGRTTTRNYTIYNASSRWIWLCFQYHRMTFV